MSRILLEIILEDSSLGILPMNNRENLGGKVLPKTTIITILHRRNSVCLEDAQAVLHGVPPYGVATLKVRKGAFDALNEGSGALGKVK